MSSDFPLRPFLPADTLALRDLFAASVEELTQDDYDEDQRAAWVAFAEDAEGFRDRLEEATTLVIELDGEPAGFASLKENSILDMLYVHPYHAGTGIGTALCDALEKIAKARGAKAITVESSETAVEFFEGRDFEATQRNSVERFGEWLATTTMKKSLQVAARKSDEVDDDGEA
ncbi:MAG: GNAT family N-acetyltransferase [Hyphomicrobium sp. 32-62-53]|nr:MAG: GNAT family N-acetyltransferase [Hyphomicrobium sp. 12-62-95]OYY00068.1 MAG: GNAT family N-acetyltransferase [Hyphomicrobium sp. 32-62-53]